MKKTSVLIRLLIATGLLSVAFSFAAFAVTINEVSFTAYLEDDHISDEITDPAFRITDGTDRGYYELSSYSSVSTNENYRISRTYELIFSAIGDNLFNQTGSSITVTGQGVESIVSRKVTDEGETLTVRVKAYPYVKLPQTTGSLDDSRIQLEKGDGVSAVEYYIVYTDYDGDVHTVHNTTTASSISVSPYTRSYSGSNEDKQDMEVVGFWCRSQKASNSANPYIVPGDWAGWGDEPNSADLTNYEYWSLYLGDSATSSSGSSGTVTSEGTGATSVQGGWEQFGNNWYYKNSNGSRATGWIQVDGYWYYLDQSSGVMLTGWFNDTDGHRYYLNPNTGGPLGSMVIGWVQDSDGNWYYLNPNAGGPKGSVTTGWILDGGLWYYCSTATGGTMLTGWFTDSDGQRYYLNPNVGGPKGSMLTGWQMLDGKWYFFRRSTASGQGSLGAAIVGKSVNIAGTTYTFDANGAMM